MKTVSMTAANPGEWQCKSSPSSPSFVSRFADAFPFNFHWGSMTVLCHVAAHWQFGMQINYNIALNGTGMC
jgi:hypothetical protein